MEEARGELRGDLNSFKKENRNALQGYTQKLEALQVNLVEMKKAIEEVKGLVEPPKKKGKR